MHVNAASDSTPPAPSQPAKRASRKPRCDLDERRLYYTVGECARAMGVDIKTARRKLARYGALERHGGWDYTTRSLLRHAFAKTSAELIAALEEARRERDREKSG